jgi:hypothetical protein
MKEQRITVEISREGKLSVDAEGFAGGTCIKELERILEGMAAPRETVDRKPAPGEMHRTCQVNPSPTNRQGGKR